MVFKLSPHFTKEQFEYSSIGNKLKIVNIMNQEQISNAVLLSNSILEPIYHKMQFKISSGFRCVELNKAIGGVITSQHCKGQACDMLPPNNMTLNSFINNIINMKLPFDQIISELGWCHISFNGKNGRKEILQMYKENGITKYKNYLE